MEKKVIDREQEIAFTNFTTEPFEQTWNGNRAYRFEVGKSYYLPFYLAEVFAKHLVDRELNRLAAEKVAAAMAADPRIDNRAKEQIETTVLGNHQLRQKLMDQCVALQDPPTVSPNAIRQVPLREAKLNAQKRTDDYVEKGYISPGDAAQRKPVAANAPTEKDFQTT